MHSLAQLPITVNHLIYTRSTSFDYQWIYGSSDKNLGATFQKHIVEWLAPNLLADHSPIITFFSIAGHHALMIAEESKTRIDQERRSIFQWSIFVWKPDERLSYEHLVPLLNALENESAAVYRDVPNDTVRFETQIRNVDFNITNLGRGTTKLMKEYWKLPYRLDWQHVLRERLTVEVPPSWSFSKMIAPLIDRSTLDGEMLYVGKSLDVANRQPSDRAWLVSAPESTHSGAEFEPRILNKRGLPLSEDELTRLSVTSVFQAGKKNASVTPTDSTISHSSNNEWRSTLGLGLSRDNRATTPVVNPKPKPEMSHGDSVFEEVAKSVAITGEKSKIEAVTRRLSTVWPFKRAALRKQQVQILLLLSPIARIGSGDIKVAWSNLLDEMLLFHRKPSKGMRKEWLRRLSELEAITVRNVPPRHAGWSDKFSEACLSLRAIVEKL